MALTGHAKREYQNNWIKSRRQAWIDENGPCRRCGGVEQLEVDHIDRATKAVNPAKLWSLAPSNPKRVHELEKCQVLCYSCHQKKTSEEVQTTEHGSTMYRNGCRCPVCREAQRTRQSVYRNANRNRL